MPSPRHLPLPVTLDEITCDWLTAALRVRAPAATVKSFEIIDVIRSTTTKLRLQLVLDEAGQRAGIPERAILKGGFEAHSRHPGMAQMHWREVIGYRDVMGPLGLPSPRFYFADWDIERQQGIIIMEDLATRGVTFCHALKPNTPEDVARRLTALARFHSQTWDKPGSSRFSPDGQWGELVDFFDAMQTFSEVKSNAENWNRFISMPRGAAASQHFHNRDWLLQAWPRLVRFSKQQPQCVLHGDLHLGNLYVDPDGTPGFLDTLASRGPGLLEVSYHVSAALDVADRPRAERALVQHYLDELDRNGVSTPCLDEAMRQYGVFLLYGFFIWMTTEAAYQSESVNTANVARVSTAMLEHDTPALYRTLD